MDRKNIFSSLEVPEETQTSSMDRKARKKLREIQKIEEKMKNGENISEVEYEKFEEKDKWEKVLDPLGYVSSKNHLPESEYEKRQQEKKQEKKQKKKQREADKIKKAQEKREREYQEEQRKRREEREKEERKWRQERERAKPRKYTIPITLESKIDVEFEDLLSTNSRRKAYLKLIKKYHPDQNKDDIDCCTEISKIINKKYQC
jgi:glucan-binding YG repeat protein